MLLFSYGTLTEPLIRDRVLGHAVPTEDAVLEGFIKVCGWDYLTLIPGDGTVRGVVFEADDSDMDRMDVWEDVPVYERNPVTVSVGGVPMEAVCYIMQEPPEHYEVVGDSRIASIPLDDIIRDVEAMMGSHRRSRYGICPEAPMATLKYPIGNCCHHGRREDQGPVAGRGHPRRREEPR